MEGAESPLLTKGQRRRHAAEIFVYLVLRTQERANRRFRLLVGLLQIDLQILRTVVTFRIYNTNHQLLNFSTFLVSNEKILVYRDWLKLMHLVW